MTEAEQEVLSKKYVAAMVIGLEDGRVALLGADRKLIQIYEDAEELRVAILEYEPPVEPERIVLVSKKSKITLTLEDLDL